MTDEMRCPCGHEEMEAFTSQTDLTTIVRCKRCKLVRISGEAGFTLAVWKAACRGMDRK